MRTAEIPEELAAQIDAVRGDTPFDTWLALAISEKVYGSRLIPTNLEAHRGTPVEEPEELWVAMVQTGETEYFLLWRYSMPQGVALAPVIVTEEGGMETWREQFAMELNFMDGPPIAWRHFTGGEFVEWLRAPAPEEGDLG